jgi:hypothetical protein
MLQALIKYDHASKAEFSVPSRNANSTILNNVFKIKLAREI